MSIENRNCNCMQNMNNNQVVEMENNIEENVLSTDDRNNERGNNCNCNNMEGTRREMANRIRGLEFAIVELALYLDTHPDDQRALCLHRKYCKECKELKDKYQKVYGPLSINYPCNKWRWLEEPWASFKLGESILNIYKK